MSPEKVMKCTTIRDLKFHTSGLNICSMIHCSWLLSGDVLPFPKGLVQHFLFLLDGTQKVFSSCKQLTNYFMEEIRYKHATIEKKKLPLIC